jgi:hypothetical protein
VKISAGAFPATLAIVILLPLGLVSCTTPTATALKCTASVSNARPVQNTVEAVTVKTVAGAQVVTSARYKTNTANVTTLSNAHGVANTFYNVGTALTSFKVNVLVTVLKGAQHATCATSFIPAAPAKNPAAPTPVVTPTPIPDPVIHLNSVKVEPTQGTALPYYEGLPSVVCNSEYRQDNLTGREACGRLTFGFYVTGLAPFKEPITQPLHDQQTFGSSSFDASVDLKWTLTCSVTNVKTYGGATVGLEGDINGKINYALNMVGDDESKVSLYLNVHYGDALNTCSGPTIATSLVASNLHISIADPALPAAPTTFSGPWSS